MNATSGRVDTNGVTLSYNKGFKRWSRRKNTENTVSYISDQNTEDVKHMGILVKEELNWPTHANKRFEKTYYVSVLLRRSIAYDIHTKIKQGLCKSLVLPIVIHGLFFAKLSKGALSAL